MSERIHADVEMEGGGSTWWYVCGECQSAVNYLADECRNCKALLIWPGFNDQKKKKIYTGEQTEPAE